jgi:anti-anti-sigma regulatory factor
MEAATQQPGENQGQETQKLAIDKFADGQIMCLKFGGTVDEDFDGKKLAGTVKARTLVLDLADISKISSFGIREWVDFINTVQKNTEEIILLECAPKVVDQLNMVANFAGTGKVFSFYAPYRCDYCDSDSRVLMQVDRDWDVIKSMKPAERPCGSCGEPEYFDEDPTSYFSYIAGQDKFEIEAEVAAFLSSKLNYVVSDAARRLRIDKYIEDRNTYVKLAGDLDGSFPREKLAEGLEGTVILDVTGAGKIEPAGAAEWRGFLQMITPTADAVYLLGAPPGFLEKLTKPEDLGAKAQVVTFAMPYSCEKCATTATHMIDVEQHYDVLKFATPPEMKCGDCKSPTVCAATEGLLSHLPTLPKPAIEQSTRKFIKTAQERKPEKKATTVAEAASQRPRSGAGTAMGAAALAAVLAIAGFWGYQEFQERKLAKAAKQRDSVGSMIEASGEERPQWISSDTRFSAYCGEDADGVACIGVSSYVDNLEDARVEAQEAALEGVANAVGLKIEDADWARNVRAIYGDTRQAKLNTFDKARTDTDSNKYNEAKRDVREGRRAVAASLRATGGAAVPTQPSAEYWEHYQSGTGEGSSFLMFVQFRVSPDNVERLVDHYGKAEEVLGASAVTVFPGIAWRYRDVISGAVISKIAAGDLTNFGLAERYIVTSIQDRQIKDAKAFANIANEEWERKKNEGGALKLIVKTGDTPPLEYNKPIHKVDRGGGRGGSRGGGRGGSRGGSTPNINRWDQAGGGSRDRDDPTQ